MMNGKSLMIVFLVMVSDVDQPSGRVWGGRPRHGGGRRVRGGGLAGTACQAAHTVEEEG